MRPPAYSSADPNAAGENLERLLGYEFDVDLIFHGASVTAEAGERLRAFVEFAGKPE